MPNLPSFELLQDKKLYTRKEIEHTIKSNYTQMSYFFKYVPVPYMKKGLTNIYKGEDVKKAVEKLKEDFEKLEESENEI